MLLDSTFHDIAYPLEEIKRWLPNIMINFLGKEGEGITPDIPVERIFFQSDTYLDFVNELARFFNNMKFVQGNREARFRAWLQKELASSKDHGILGSLLLLKPNFLKKEEIILPSALAIALHKRLGTKIKTRGIKISYDEFPLFFLLLYCDLVQEWNRELHGKERTTLEKIIVTKDVNDLGNEKRNIPQQIIQNKETIYIHSEIIVSEEVQRKIEECRGWFDFIHSSNPYFSIKINDRFIPEIS